MDLPRRGAVRTRFYAGWISAVILTVALLAGLVAARDISIHSQTTSLAQHEAEGPVVLVAPVRKASQSRTIVYPAGIHGYFESPLYPKVPGYVTSILVDKGARVHTGQLLAVIEDPELDQQVRDAAANYQIAKLTDDRNQVLVHQAVVPQQTADQTHAAMLSAKAQLDSLRAQQAYERLIAPFDGIITARNVDPGALVALQTAQQGSVPVLEAATLRPVRIYVNLPQDDAAFIRDGVAAAVTVSQFPNRKFIGPVTRHPEALNSQSRTMLVEVDLPNDDLSLLPGMYAQVEITLQGVGATPLVPDDALIFNGDKVFVPLVYQNRIHLVQVKLGMDDGITCEVTEGLSGGETVALNLGQSARDGEAVQPRTAHEP